MSMSVRDDAHRPRVGRRARPPRPLPDRAPTCATRATCGCSPRSRGSTAGAPGHCSPTPGRTVTLREFLDEGRFSAYFARHFMEPLVAAVWSCDPDVALDYPARYLFTFLDHHGMLGVFGSPQWRTVTGGSQRVRRRGGRGARTRSAPAPRSPRCSRPPTASRSPTATAWSTTYDAVVVATHPGQALAMLAEPTPRAARGARRDAVLAATPRCCTPTPRCCRAPAAPGRRGTSAPRGADGGVTVTYDLTRLQRLDTDTHYLVTLGGEDLVDPATVIDRMEYEHPLYNPASVAAQRRLPEIDTDRVAFAGAYHGWGFHEDGARSGLAAVERLGLTWPAAPRTVRLPRVRRASTRPRSGTPGARRSRAPSRTARTPGWSTSTTCPTTALLGRFEARDHLGDPERRSARERRGASSPRTASTCAAGGC